MFRFQRRLVNPEHPFTVDDFWEALFPLRCRYCRAGGVRLCEGCVRDLPWNPSACPGCAAPQSHPYPCPRCSRRPPAFDAAWCPFILAHPVRQQIHGLKYRDKLLDAALLAHLLAPRLPSRPDLILPVPLHRWRLLRRGYNQAVELAKALSRETGIPHDAQVARRLRSTAAQTGQSAAARRRNLRGAFAVSAAVEGLHVAILDDVMTTGATMGALARACRDAGARRVEAWAVARTP